MGDEVVIEKNNIKKGLNSYEEPRPFVFIKVWQKIFFSKNRNA